MDTKEIVKRKKGISGYYNSVDSYGKVEIKLNIEDNSGCNIEMHEINVDGAFAFNEVIILADKLKYITSDYNTFFSDVSKLKNFKIKGFDTTSK